MTAQAVCRQRTKRFGTEFDPCQRLSASSATRERRNDSRKISRFLTILLVVLLTTVGQAGVPASAQFYEYQLVDHHDNDLVEGTNSNRTYWKQRYYFTADAFQGPGSPIFLIFGGEGALEPTTGLMYPFVAQDLAQYFGAAVLTPEHRFYGASQPVSSQDINEARRAGLPDPRFALLTPEQAIRDYLRLLRVIQKDRLNCSLDRFSATYCPVITVGGSYSGFLSALARVAFPAVVDMAYAASAPMQYYAQKVPGSAYYEHISAVAEKAIPGCRQAVKSVLQQFVSTVLDESTDLYDAAQAIGICPGTLPSYIENNKTLFVQEVVMMVAYTFANHNMEYYPPRNETRLHKACEIFLSRNGNDENGSDDQQSVRLRLPSKTMAAVSFPQLQQFLVSSLAQTQRDMTFNPPDKTCFDMRLQLPTGANSTVSAGDWSGVGNGQSGDSWDFQTCTLCVEDIDITGMLAPARSWTLDWLTQHCQTRYGEAVKPRPFEIFEKWHFDQENLIAKGGASRILFTNGLNDGWSVSGIQKNLSDTVLALNFPNGAHHSELSGWGPRPGVDTADIAQGFVQVKQILASWLQDVRNEASTAQQQSNG